MSEYASLGSQESLKNNFTWGSEMNKNYKNTTMSSVHIIIPNTVRVNEKPNLC